MPSILTGETKSPRRRPDRVPRTLQSPFRRPFPDTKRFVLISVSLSRAHRQAYASAACVQPSVLHLYAGTLSRGAYTRQHLAPKYGTQECEIKGANVCARVYQAKNQSRSPQRWGPSQNLVCLQNLSSKVLNRSSKLPIHFLISSCYALQPCVALQKSSRQ